MESGFYNLDLFATTALDYENIFFCSEKKNKREMRQKLS